MKKILLLLGILVPMVINAQIKRYAPNVVIDSLFLLPDIPMPILQSGSSYYTYDLNKIVAVDNFTIPNSPTFYNYDSILYAAIAYEDGYLLSLGHDLVFQQNDQRKKWQFPLPVEQGITTALAGCGADFFFLVNNTLYAWRQKEYIVEKIGDHLDLEDLTSNCDQWGLIWGSDGELVYRIGMPNDRLPILAINQIPRSSPEKYTINAYHPERDKLKVSFQYKGDSTWIPIDPASTLTINPNSTSPTLKIRATVDQRYYQYREVPLNKISSTHSFPWWIIALPLSILFTAYIFLNREKAFKLNLQKEKERYRLLTELNKQQEQVRQLQMNPHFLFNTLNGINALISLDKNLEARSYLTQFSRMMRQVLQFSTQEKITLEEELKYLNDYLSLEKFAHSDLFDFDLRNDADEEIALPSMLVQPLIENAIQHGIKGVSYRGLITISCVEEGNNLIIQVEDNGIGINRSQKSDHSSMALQIIKDRLNSIHRFRKGQLLIVDKSVKNQEESGTLATLTIPI